MCVLEGFHLFKICLYIVDNFFVESRAYVYHRVQKHCLSFRYFGRVLIALFEENYDVWFTQVPQGKKYPVCSIGLKTVLLTRLCVSI